MDSVGIVIARRPPSESSFEFELEGDAAPGDFVEVPVEAGALVARVAGVRVENQYLAESGVVRELRLGMRMPSAAALASAEVRVARAEALGIVSGASVLPPIQPPSPGSRVYRAAPETLRALLGLAEGGVELGRLWRHGLEVELDPERLFRHHVAVLGSTGSGKSYTCGVLAEEALERGLPAVILDFHGEYATLGERYRVRSVRANRVKLEPGSVSPDAIADATEMTDVQRDLLYLAFDEAEGPSLEDLERAAERVAERYGFKRETLLAVLRRLRMLKAQRVFTGEGEPLYLSEGEAVVVDLGLGLPGGATRALAGAIAWWLFEGRRAGEQPPFLLVADEAHRLLPQDEQAFSKAALRLVAREGRKFGASLVVASQRVVGLDKDVLSQCGTKIALRMDSPTDLAMLKPLLGRHARLLPRLPTGVALVAGVAVGYPVLVEVRKRRTSHGGSGAPLFAR